MGEAFLTKSITMFNGARCCLVRLSSPSEMRIYPTQALAARIRVTTKTFTFEKVRDPNLNHHFWLAFRSQETSHPLSSHQHLVAIAISLDPMPTSRPQESQDLQMWSMANWGGWRMMGVQCYLLMRSGGYDHHSTWCISYVIGTSWWVQWDSLARKAGKQLYIVI